MTDAGHKVLAGFVRLSDADRRGVIAAMNRFAMATPEERSALQREFETTVMGPVGTACPCCQR